MSEIDISDIFITAKKHFESNDYKTAEILLQRAMLHQRANPDIFYMLGTIYYDSGKFNKAVRAFERALEIEPTFTDASVGLSIIYNDLGRYEEGRKVFETAATYLRKTSQNSDPYIDEKIAKKHEELGHLYMQCQRLTEALDQFLKALKLSTRRLDLSLKVIDCLEALGNHKEALKYSKRLVLDFPQFSQARNRLARLYYNSNRVADAVEQWENILLRDPENSDATRNLKMAQAAGITSSF